MALYSAYNCLAFQIPYRALTFVGTVYGVYLASHLNATDQKLPKLIQFLSITCCVSGAIKLVLEAVLLVHWTGVSIVLNIFRIALVPFIVSFATIIAIFMTRICSSSSFEYSIHSNSYLLLFAAGIAPALVRFLQNFYLLFHFGKNPFLTPESFVPQEFVVNDFELSGAVILIPDTLVIFYLIALVSALLFYTIKLRRKKAVVDLAGSRSLPKWRLASDLALSFFAVSIIPTAVLVASYTVEYFQTPENVAEIQYILSVIKFSSVFYPTDIVGLLMTLAMIRSRSIYQSDIELKRRKTPKIVVVESKKLLDQCFEDLRAEFQIPLDGPPTSQPPPVAPQPHRFQDNTNSIEQPPTINQTGTTLENEAGNFFANLPHIGMFMNETPVTASQYVPSNSTKDEFASLNPNNIYML